MSVRKFIALTSALVMAFFIGGCADEKTNDLGYYPRINVYNWSDYIDPSVIKGFEEEYGIKVNYENFATNEEMLAKLKTGSTDYDVIFPSDYMVEALIALDMLEELDFGNLPNFANIDPSFKDLGFDPGNRHSVPYFWGTMGIVYDSERIPDGITSWRALWDERFAGKIVMLDSPRDTIGITLKMLGYSANSRDVGELNEAVIELIRQKPLVRSYEIDAYKDMMASGDAVMALCWSGDAMLLIDEHPNLRYVIPEEGTNVWVDCMAVPKTTKHKREAELFIDYMMRPEVNAACAQYVGYSTANQKAAGLLPEEVRLDEARYPSGNVWEHGEVFVDLGDFSDEYDRAWTEIKSR
ncbi:MAG TPA: spermidine/putrescine ABC transporter substrate-binding protein [Bacillota bacterium]|nr:spermidine/putrescine ABC transporter substrate-binding protein [Bacillota bacterium]HOA15173.1 spermidine/putrescine ABC transporter substrate-binding protein [Bacillota bacterium]HOG52241.1 spermidine/putrescine ABC transporter substrate-binding protein [Bacillota bacterium]